MTSIIVSLSVVFLIYEFSILIKPYKYNQSLKRISTDLKQGFLNPNDKGFIIFNFVYFIWNIIGLFTTYWPIFIAIILISIVSSNISKMIKSDISRSRHRMVDATFSILLLSFLLFSYYM